MRSLLGLLVVLGTACGDDGVGKLPDGPPEIDAPNIDASLVGTVTLTITSDTTPVPNVKVYFQNADSSLVALAMTDANGVASATMLAGGYVTAIDPFANVPVPLGIAAPTDLRTFAGVKPGDQLQLRERVNLPVVNITIGVLRDINATNYFLYTNCGTYDISFTGGSGTPGGPLQLVGCGATTDFVLEARDGTGIAINSILKAGVVLAEGGTIDFTADTYVATEDVTWSYSNVPAGIGSLNVRAFLASSLGPVVDTQTSALVNNSAATTTLKRPVIAGALGINITTSSGGAFGSHTVAEWAPSTAAYSLDMSTLLLPEYNASPTFDAATHTISWTAAAGGTQPDFARISAQFSSNTVAWNWDVAAPHTTASVALPVLPAPDDQFNPAAADPANVSDVLTAKVPGGYDAIRATVLSLSSSNLESLVVGSSGRVVIEELSRVQPVRPAPERRRAAPRWPVRTR